MQRMLFPVHEALSVHPVHSWGEKLRLTIAMPGTGEHDEATRFFSDEEKAEASDMILVYDRKVDTTFSDYGVGRSLEEAKYSKLSKLTGTEDE